MKTNLMNHVVNGTELTKLLLNLLKKLYYVRVEYQDKKSAVIVYKEKWFCLNDNGGEINIFQINGKDLVSIPTTCHPYTTVETTAYRIGVQLSGGKILWEFSLDSVGKTPMIDEDYNQ